MEWISTKDELPNENEIVLVCVGDKDFYVAKIEKGISMEEREKMKRGEIDDPTHTGWNLSKGYFQVKRSDSYGRADEGGNNEVPYCWIVCRTSNSWFGQYVKYWARIEPPKENEDG